MIFRIWYGWYVTIWYDMILKILHGWYVTCSGDMIWVAWRTCAGHGIWYAGHGRAREPRSHTREQPLLYTMTIQYTIQTPLACERLKLISEDPLPTAALLHHINCSSEMSTLFKITAKRCLAKTTSLKSWHPFCTLKTRSRFSTFVKWPKYQNYGQLVLVHTHHLIL